MHCLGELLKLCLPFPSVSLPANDYLTGGYGPWVAQRDGERVELGSRIRATCHSPSAEPGGGHASDDLPYIGPHVQSRNARVRYVNPKGHEQDRCCLCRLASSVFAIPYELAVI